MPRFTMLSLTAAVLVAALVSSTASAQARSARPSIAAPQRAASVFRMRERPPRHAGVATEQAPATGGGARGFAMPAGATTAPDGAGGTYVVWASDRDGVGDIYLQRVTSSGTVASGWPATGLAVCTAPGVQMEAGLVTDGGTGVFVGWADFRNEPFNGFSPTANLYVQKVDASGTPQWMPDGVLALPDVSFDGGIGVAPDGAGGALFAWSQGDPGDIYAQRIDASGTAVWGSPGVLVCGDPDDQYLPVIAADGAGGAYIAWEDVRGVDFETYAQYLNAAGAPQWAANGVALTGGVEGYEPGICSDGAGGMLAFWLTVTDVIGQRYNAAGAELWTPGGESVGASSFFATEVQARADGSGGAYLVWRDPQVNTNVYMQRVSSAGAELWTSGGVTVCSASGDRFVEDGYVEPGGGFTLLWDDTRAPFGIDLYAQKLNGSGVPQWTADGVLMCSDVQREQGFVISTDGAGGAVAAWISHDNIDAEPRAQHVNAAGAVQLGANGTTVVADPGRQRYAATAPDGSGGTWVVWHEKVSGHYDVHAKRLDGSGVPLTGTIVVCNAADDQYVSGAVTDGAGGVVVGWEDLRLGGESDIYAQRVSSAGAPLWTANGVAVCDIGGDQGDTRMISDGAGSAIFAWTDYRSGPDIYAQRLNAAGAPLWTAGGVGVCTLAGNQVSPVLAPSGANGAVIAWIDDNFPISRFVGAQRLDGAGAPQWAANGVTIANAFGLFNRALDAVSDGSDGAIVLFEEQLVDPGTFAFITTNPVAQRVDAAGNPQWNGLLAVEICDVNGYRQRTRLVSDGAGGAIAAWSDGRGGMYDVYAQRVNGSGVLQWAAGGIAVCNAQSWQWLSGLHEDGAGGAVLAWTDERTGLPDVYAQRVNAGGTPQWTANGVQVVGAVRGQFEAALHVAGGESFLAWTDYRDATERLIFAQKLNASGVAQWGADGVTSALFSMVAAEAGLDRVRVTWQLGASVAEVTAYRQVEGGAGWTSLGPVAVDGVGRVVLEDAAVVPGARYAYRIGMMVDGEEVFSDEVWIEVPNALALAIERLSPQPARREVWVTFTLPVLAPARLEVLDVAGRRVGGRGLLGLSPGRHVLRVDEVPDEAGVYFVRVWQGGEWVSGRVVRVR